MDRVDIWFQPAPGARHIQRCQARNAMARSRGWLQRERRVAICYEGTRIVVWVFYTWR